MCVLAYAWPTTPFDCTYSLLNWLHSHDTVITVVDGHRLEQVISFIDMNGHCSWGYGFLSATGTRRDVGKRFMKTFSVPAGGYGVVK